MHVGIANWQNLGYQQITDLDPAVGLDVPEGARFAILVAEAQHVRWRDDGDDPTTAIGMLLKTTDQPFLYAGSLEAIRFFDDTAGAILNVSYYA